MAALQNGRELKYVEPIGWRVDIVWRTHRVAGYYHIYQIILKQLH